MHGSISKQFPGCMFNSVWCVKDTILTTLIYFIYFFPPPFLRDRHEARRAGDLQTHAPREAVHDVQCHAQQGGPARLQEVHARRE